MEGQKGYIGDQRLNPFFVQEPDLFFNQLLVVSIKVLEGAPRSLQVKADTVLLHHSNIQAPSPEGQRFSHALFDQEFGDIGNHGEMQSHIARQQMPDHFQRTDGMSETMGCYVKSYPFHIRP